MNTGPHATLSVRHDEFAHRFAAMPDLRSMNGNGDLALIKGTVYYGETVIATRLTPNRVEITTGDLGLAETRARNGIRKALKAEGYTRVLSRQKDRFEFFCK